MSSLLLAAFLAAVPADTLVVGTLADPGSLAPHQATDIVAAEIVSSVCETLVRVRPGSLRHEGVLATSWASPDQRTWTLTLRQNVRFHDGTALDADAVVGNLDHLRRERGFPGRAERLGPHLVQITLDRPNAALLSTLSQPFFAMQSPGRLSGRGSEVPVGTGAFRFAESRDGLVELAAFDGHWAGAPRLRRLVFRRFPHEASLAEALAAGEADVSSAVGPGRADRLRSEAGVTLDSQTGLNVIYLALNNERAPFTDARVRRALSRAIDRVSLVREVLGGHAEPAHTVLPPTLFGHDTRTRELVLDLDSARRLLAAARLPDGFPTTLTVSRAPRPYLLDPLRVAERLRENLSRVGAAVALREVPSWSEHVSLTSRGDFDMALLGWQADTLDPNDFLTALVDSGSIDATNRSRYRSAEMDGLIKRARMDSAPRTRLDHYRRAQDLLQHDMPLVPLYHASVFTAHRREVHGLVIGPTGILRYDKAWKQP
ncbi:MAG TPA: ABC transporter substrate-binding protein [Vicinamibacteria bacterium]|nr:ABC transporter substrate-binding protein [Vicinamibacteria bacterium]